MSFLPTIDQLAGELAAGRTTAVALTEAALARALNESGEGSRVFTHLDPKRARGAAHASDSLRAAGIVRSPLEGIPVSIKDCIDMLGQVSTAGSTVLRDAVPAQQNASVVDRLIAAGAVIVGRTNMTEFAFSGLGINPHYDTPANPWDRAARRIPGGSSSGAAVSVTDGMAAVGIGTDTGGSVRIPSALCGLTGFKPTQRRVPISGTVPLSTSLDSIGPLAASVRCCAITDAVLSGQPPVLPAGRNLAGARLALPTTVVLDDLDDDVATAFERAMGKLSAAGAQVSRLAMPEFAEIGPMHIRGTLAAAESWAWHRKLLAERGDDYDPRVASRIVAGEKMGAADYIDLVAARQRWRAQVEARLAGFDAMVMPTVPVVAPRIADLQASDVAYFSANSQILRGPSLINFLDGCGLSLPCHEPGTAPVGLTLAGPAGTDALILALGLAAEKTLASD